MDKLLAIGLVAGTLGLCGCTTTDLDTADVGKSAAARKAEPIRYITGSRIPDKPPRDRMIRRIEGEDWVRGDQSSIISHSDRPGAN